MKPTKKIASLRECMIRAMTYMVLDATFAVSKESVGRTNVIWSDAASSRIIIVVVHRLPRDPSQPTL
ncbi:MAG: hypothetical protein ABR985_08960 [Methanotrichaceae archaeon]